MTEKVLKRFECSLLVHQLNGFRYSSNRFISASDSLNENTIACKGISQRRKVGCVDHIIVMSHCST